ncbi:hypothetical protein CEXT_624241 [Caerostris extrusa]|uniref:Uncharacterized protein n=1 Tax=Caerostris extrusa TaxID=172846 RepID=A0AAV4WDH7_CAEEX|nr:hypothetical protein CEXT_624241 [Caerostris extrusa]
MSFRKGWREWVHHEDLTKPHQHVSLQVWDKNIKGGNWEEGSLHSHSLPTLGRLTCRHVDSMHRQEAFGSVL